MSQRVVVFFDWQNVYRRARGAFCDETYDSHIEGQVDPFVVANKLVARHPDRELKEVRIYRGIPTNKNNPKGYAANRRHTAAWMTGSPKPYVYLRPLQYLEGYDPREKGIDVQLAIDFVVMAVRKQYDVGILFSTDTDLNPAIEAVYDLNEHNGPVAEVAAWKGPHNAPKRIGGGTHRKVWCHWLGADDYAAVRDTTDYSHG